MKAGLMVQQEAKIWCSQLFTAEQRLVRLALHLPRHPMPMPTHRFSSR